MNFAQMKNLFLLIILSLCFTNIQAQVTINPDAVAETQAVIPYAIYPLGDSSFTIDEVQDLIRKNYPEINIAKNFPETFDFTGSNVFIDIENGISEESAPPDVFYLNYFGYGLSDQQKDDLQSAKQIVNLVFFCDQASLTETVTKANDLFDKITDKEIVIWDWEAREAFTQTVWKEARTISKDGLDLTKQIGIHFYDEGEHCRIITLGMSKFGLPDICINDLACSGGESAYALVSLVAQTLLEKNKIGKDGKLSLNIDEIKNASCRSNFLENMHDDGTKKGVVILKEDKMKEGDPYNVIMALQFKSKNPQVEQDELLKSIFGFEDELVLTDHNDELLEASNNAKKRIPELKTIFENPETNTVLLMKFFFSDGNDDGEWMWVEIKKWKGNKTTGLLQNEPYVVKNLKSGQMVTNKVDGMFDYILYHPDGTEEGNETGKILMKQR